MCNRMEIAEELGAFVDKLVYSVFPQLKPHLQAFIGNGAVGGCHMIRTRQEFSNMLDNQRDNAVQLAFFTREVYFDFLPSGVKLNGYNIGKNIYEPTFM